MKWSFISSAAHSITCSWLVGLDFFFVCLFVCGVLFSFVVFFFF